jgi:hypothetical protein
MVVSAQGIDVSGFQPPLTSQTLSGLSFAFCKASEGLSIIDPCLSWNWQAIKSAGKVRGATTSSPPSGRPWSRRRSSSTRFARTACGPVTCSPSPPGTAPGSPAR